MFCNNCGKEIPDNTTFCPSCGAKQGAGAGAQTPPPVYTGTVENGNMNRSGIVERNIAIAIILTVVTCGIYGIYWFIMLTDEVNRLSGNENDTSGGIAFLLTLVTCGIYGYYWAYKIGEKIDTIKGNPAGSSNILFLILQIFGLGIVNYALAQDAINVAVR